jgi:multiple sugar transport system permease protein
VSAGRTWAQTAGLIMIGPAVFLSALVVLGPFVYVVFQAFVQKKTGVIGLDNFEWLLGPAFVPALWNTLIISIGSVALEIIVAVPLALLLNERLHGRAALRGIVTLPWAIPTIAVATAFLWLGNTNYGLFNQLGSELGLLNAPIAFIGQPGWATLSVIVAHAWKGLPLVFIILLSSLQSLSHEIVEAARVDGAGRWTTFQHIILPHLAPAIALAGVLSGIYNFALFDITFLLTGGGPSGQTTTLPLLLYNQAFRSLDAGRAAAIGLVIFLAGVVALVIVQRVTSRARR